jgi:hypothetical protein
LISIINVLQFGVESTFAYIDPGSGSMLISILIASAATAIYFLRGFFYEKLRYIFKKQSTITREKHNLVFYSEGRQYWHVFMPIIRELDRRGIKHVYLSSDKDDPGLKAEYENTKAEYIGEGHQAYYQLNNLHTNMVVMTTPGLDVLQIKRSKNVQHYSHIVHSLQDTSTYPPYGVDNYDSVMVNGEVQQSIIRQIEEARGSRKKIIEIIGSTYLETMEEEFEQLIKSSSDRLNDRKTILVAPSWGDKSLLNRFGYDLIDRLVTNNFRVILRPHPQSWQSEAEVLEEIKNNFGQKENLAWDDSPHGLEAMHSSDAMITDLSGIIFDYMFLFDKPAIIAEFEIDPRKYDMNILPAKESALMALIREGKVGYVFSEIEVENIGEIIEKANSAYHGSKDFESIKGNINKYPGQAGIRGAEFILDILGGLSANAE